MLIDIHTHAYPEKIVDKAMNAMITKVKECDLFFEDSCCDGRVESLVNILCEDGFDHGVLLPVATKASQPQGINAWVREMISSELNSDGMLIPFASAHPDMDNAEEELKAMKEFGCRGIKLHCESMTRNDIPGINADDPCMNSIYEICSSLDLIIVFHCGADPLMPDAARAHCSAERLSHVLDNFRELKVVSAHMGGFYDWDNAVRYLNKYPDRCFFDTACQNDYLTPEKFTQLVEKYGSDRVLFGSDMPWQRPHKTAELVHSAALSDDSRDKIFGLNAAELLKL